ncbi:MAG: lysylphosphatidylglycerol synthase transmembrane domain-containing protein [Erysipelotrichaceae bacterium]|nr:lysylphosphatidylglycerol synthase transmembrane domain-containing protein [Erysipelotrichaceae bacterium]
MKKIFKSYLFNILVIVSFTILALYFTLKDDFKTIINTLANVKIPYLLLVLGLVLLIQVLIGMILTTITKLSNPHYKLRYGIVNALVATFFHGITPSASGGQFAQVYVFKKQGVDIADSASVLWMDFIIYQATMCLTVLLLILLRFTYFYQKYSQFYIFVLLGFLINAFVIFGLWAIARFKSVYTFLTTTLIRIAHKFRIVKDIDATLHNIDVQLEKFKQETDKLKKHKSIIIKCIILNVIRCLLYYAVPYFVYIALGFEVHPGMLVSMMALTSFVSMTTAFIPIPGASGGTEAVFTLMFSAIMGLKASKSVMILWRFASFYFIMLVGALAFVYSKASKEVEVHHEDRHIY